MSQLPRGVIQKGGRFYLRIRRTVDGRKTETTEPLGTNEVIARAAGRRRRRQHQEWKDQPTVRDFGERWLAEYVTPMRTDKGPTLARQRLKDYVLPVLGGLYVAEVTEAHGMALRAFVERPRRRVLKSGESIENFLSTTSVRHVLSDARCLFSFAIAARLIERNPITGRVFPRIQEEIPNPLSDIELQRVLESCPESHRLLVGLALWTGLRYSELRGLRWEDVVLEGDPHVTVVRTGHADWTKSRRTRRVPLLPEAVRILEASPHGSGWIFTGRFGEMIGREPGPFNQVIAKAVPGYSFHRLRHTMASRFLRAGGLMATLQRILGHSSIKTTERYAKLFPDEVAAQVRQLPLNWMPEIVGGEGAGNKWGTGSQ